jgi:hypothetical protein
MIETRSRYAESEVRNSRRFALARVLNCKTGNMNPTIDKANEVIRSNGRGRGVPPIVVMTIIRRGIAAGIAAHINRSVVIFAAELLHTARSVDETANRCSIVWRKFSSFEFVAVVP